MAITVKGAGFEDFKLPEVGQVFKTQHGELFKRTGENEVVALGLAGPGVDPSNVEGRTLGKEAFIKQYGQEAFDNLEEFNVADLNLITNNVAPKMVTNINAFEPVAFTETGGTMDLITPHDPRAQLTPEQEAFAASQGPQASPVADIQQFTRQLSFGMTGEDVKQLQRFLNNSGFLVAEEGEGSPGNETTFFGPLTQAALQEYQKSQGIVSEGDPTTTGFGRFGPKTMASINETIQVGTPTSGTTTPDIDPDVVINAQTEENASLDQLLADSGLPDDQQQAIRSIYDAIAARDADRAQELMAAFESATKISDPFFAQQIKLANDALTRGFISIEDDLAFREEQLRTKLADLKEDVRLGKESLTLDEQQQIKNLERALDQELKDTRQTMASRGMTFSTRRAEAEELAEDITGELVETTERKFGEKRGGLTRAQDRTARDVQSEIARLTELAKEKKLDFFRQAEAEVGTGQLPSLGGLEPLGGISGDINRRKFQDILSATESFIF